VFCGFVHKSSTVKPSVVNFKCYVNFQVVLFFSVAVGLLFLYVLFPFLSF